MNDENRVCLCPCEGVIDVIGRKWALLAITTIGNRGSIRFGELEKELDGISPKTLSDTLKELLKEGLVVRESFAEIPPRVEYSLSPDGVELRKAVVPLLTWAAARSGSCAGRCECVAGRHESPG